MKKNVEFLHVLCDVCKSMPEIRYRGLKGRIPTFVAICHCGRRLLQFFNRCDRFPDKPTLHV